MRTIFTCGCFDLFHVGHLLTLVEAQKKGNYVTVGISSDEVIRKSKGEGRPIIPQNKRALIISAITGVDEVVIGHKENFVDWILKNKPDVYIKGGDYNIDTICQKERKAIESYGGEIVFTELMKDVSTTKIVEEIRE